MHHFYERRRVTLDSNTPICYSSDVMEKHGEALIIAREEEVMRHGHVMFGLVKPRREGKELLLESSAAMVNVLPRKRSVYRVKGEGETERSR